MGFRKELEELINKHSMENESNTPDFILADYLLACLTTWENYTKEREKWYGIKLDPAARVLIGGKPK